MSGKNRGRDLCLQSMSAGHLTKKATPQDVGPKAPLHCHNSHSTSRDPQKTFLYWLEMRSSWGTQQNKVGGYKLLEWNKGSQEAFWSGCTSQGGVLEKIPGVGSLHPGDRRRRGPALRSPAPANADQWESRMLACGRCGWVATAWAGRRRSLPEEPQAVRHGRAGRWDAGVWLRGSSGRGWGRGSRGKCGRPARG